MDAWPEEAVGFIIEQSDGGPLVYVRARNAHATPLTHFLVAAEETESMVRMGTVMGIHHSHPMTNIKTGEGLCPSEADFEAQQDWRVPFYITSLSPRKTYVDFFGWGDQLPTPSIKNRQFRHAVTDCYALVRHLVFAATGRVTLDAPRGMGWWADPAADSPIERGLAASGWVDIPMEELQPGDGLLLAIRTGRAQHCGLYLGGDLFAHHLHGRLSAVDPLPQWRRFLQKAVRLSAPGAN